MRILFVADALAGWHTGLAAPSAHALARMAQRDGHAALLVVAMTGIGALPSAATVAASGTVPGVAQGAPLHLLDGVPVLCWPLDGADGVDDPFARWLAAAPFDIAHAVVTTPMLSRLQGLPHDDRPLLLGLAGLPDEPVPAAALAALRRAQACVAPSDHAAARWRLAVPGLPVRTLAHGIDLLALLQSRQADAAQPLPPTLACVVDADDGRTGTVELLAAFARVERSDLRLRLIASGGPRSHAWAALRARADADPRVSLEAAVGPGLVGLRGGLHAVAVPSLVPLAFSLPVHEAAALGLPCLVSDLGAQAEAVRGLGHGVVLPPGDVPAWAQAIADWAAAHDGCDVAAAQGDVPLRVEEQAFLCQGLYQELLYRQARG